MTRVLFFFAGTGDTADAYYQRHNASFTDFESNDDVIKIFIDGCQAPKVGGSAINPDLETPTENIARAFSSNDNGTAALDLAQLKREFGESIIIKIQPKGPNTADTDIDTPTVTVDRVITAGFSRGAWMANKLLRKIDHLGVDLYVGGADQPVLGKGENQFGSNELRQEMNFSNLKNLKRYCGYLGDYHLNTTWVERRFFWQSIPDLPKSLPEDRIEIFMLPHKDHFESHRGKSNVTGFVRKLFFGGTNAQQKEVSPIPFHMCRSLEMCINEPKFTATLEQDQTEELVQKHNLKNEDLSEDIVFWYANKFETGYCDFTPKNLKLPIQGQVDQEGNLQYLQNDPYYFKALIKEVTKNLIVRDGLDVKLQSKLKDSTIALSPQQAYAIFHMLPSNLDHEIVKYILQDDLSAVDKRKQDELIQVINDIGTIRNYMRYEKAYSVLSIQAIDHYQKALNKLFFDHMSAGSTDEASKATFLKALEVEETKLIKALVRFPTFHIYAQLFRKAVSDFVNSYYSSTQTKANKRDLFFAPRHASEAIKEATNRVVNQVFSQKLNQETLHKVLENNSHEQTDQDKNSNFPSNR